MTAKLSDAGMLLAAQRAATKNAARMANAACHYAVSLNRGWLNLWDSYLDDYLDPPKHFVNAQTAFIEQAFDHYQESVQQLGSLAAKATRNAQSAVNATEAVGRSSRMSIPIGNEGNGLGQPSEGKPDARWRRRTP